MSVAGNNQHGALDSGNPVKVGGVYKSAPSAVPDLSRTDALTDSVGRFVVVSVGPGGAAPTVARTPSTTGTMAQVPSSATAVTILAANTARMGATIVNDSTSILYLSLSAAVPTTTAYTVALAAKTTTGSVYEVPYAYTGIIQGIWASANGFAAVTQFT